MAFDVEEWLSGHGGRRMRGYGGIQMEFDCPFCGKPRHMYVALEKRVKSSGRVTYPGDFICFKCDARGRFIKLYSEIEGVPWKEARLILTDMREPMPDPSKARYMTEKATGLKAKKSAPISTAPTTETGESVVPPSEGAGIYTAPTEGPSAPEDDGKPHTPLPPEFIACWDEDRNVWRIPKYLKARGIEKQTIAAFGLGYADHGEYGGRIILPVRCPEGESFTTRAIDSDEFLRYKAGPGCGQLLFGWEAAMSRLEDPTYDGTLVVCEGPFDALSIFQAGFAAVAIMGKRFKAEQTHMIASSGARLFVMMLDGDALKDAIQQAPELGTRTRIAGALGAKDANEAGSDMVQEAIRGARPVESARVDLLSGTVARLRAKMLK